MAMSLSALISMKRKVHRGRGVINSLIDRLPFEAHIPGYLFCGPGTRLKERLSRGEEGINDLDRACKEHDIAYSRHKDLIERHRADKVLEEKAWQRVKAKDSGLGEKAAALFVNSAMKVKRKVVGGKLRKRIVDSTRKIRGRIRNVKRKIGGSIRKKKKKAIKFMDLVRAARVNDVRSIGNASSDAFYKARKFLGSSKSKPKPPRILPIPKLGGFLPFLVPIMAALSAVGSLAGGAAGIAKTINEAKNAKLRLEEMKRHNRRVEGEKIGNGMYLKPYKKGYGLFLRLKKNQES